ncbi:MAG: primosomal protein N' [Gammaproteobacteria bacterium]
MSSQPTTKMDRLVLKVAVPSPLFQTFDYLPPLTSKTDISSSESFLPGTRVSVPFGRSTRIGVLVDQTNGSSIEQSRLKKALEIIDSEPVLPKELMELLTWASQYYHHPLGDVINNALPVLLRKGQPASIKGGKYWQLTPQGHRIDPASLSNAPRQAELLEILQSSPEGVDTRQFSQVNGNWRAIIRQLQKKAWVESKEKSRFKTRTPDSTNQAKPIELNDAQRNAVETISGNLGHFRTCLLEGVTGSGKTEVYFSVIEKVLAKNQQVLILVPEIGLTPQLLQRFNRRFSVPVHVLHSGLSDRKRLDAWIAGKNGDAEIIIGTRSAVFTPLANPGLIIIDEEHDASLKQQDGFRYHARDLAIVRANKLGIPVILGSATPSLESLANAQQNRYLHIPLSERAGNASHPVIRILDVRKQKMFGNISHCLLDAMRHHLKNNNQVMIFLNRRGYAPALYCHDCGWLAECGRCDARMVYHQSQNKLFCHHCDAQRPVERQCPTCGSDALHLMGFGTERLENMLKEEFPDSEIVRIDQDTTRRKNSLQALIESVQQGTNQILIGTQMIAKGHHLPNVTLVGIVDTDQCLFSVDFRSSERMGQLIVQVAGRAGREGKSGEVFIQTHYPDNPLLNQLLQHDYSSFSRQLLEERRQAKLPPFTSLAILRAEATNEQLPVQFLQDARALGENSHTEDHASILGPVPAPMERRAGRYRAQLLIQSDRRSSLQIFLRSWIPNFDSLRSSKKVKWSIDVDPADIF